MLQLVSPALPVGAFSYSEGLEVLIQAGSIADEQAIQAWLEAELQWGSVRLEAAALSPLAVSYTHLTLLRSQLRRLAGGQQPAIKIDQAPLGCRIGLGGPPHQRLRQRP